MFYIVTCGQRSMKFGPADFGYVLELVAKLRAGGAAVVVHSAQSVEEMN